MSTAIENNKKKNILIEIRDFITASIFNLKKKDDTICVSNFFHFIRMRHTFVLIKLDTFFSSSPFLFVFILISDVCFINKQKRSQTTKKREEEELLVSMRCSIDLIVFFLFLYWVSSINDPTKCLWQICEFLTMLVTLIAA